MGPNISEPKVEKEKKVPKETGEAVEPEDLARPPVRVMTKEEEEIEEYYRLQEQMAQPGQLLASNGGDKLVECPKYY